MSRDNLQGNHENAAGSLGETPGSGVPIAKNPIAVSEAQPQDYEKLREIFLTVRRKAFFWTDPEKLILSDFDESTKGELILTAYHRGEAVGFVSAWVPDKFIHSLFVLPEFQGGGAGTALIREAADRVGLPLALKCVKANTSALGYYQSHGWSIEKEEADLEGPYYLMKYGGR